MHAQVIFIYSFFSVCFQLKSWRVSMMFCPMFKSGETTHKSNNLLQQRYYDYIVRIFSRVHATLLSLLLVYNIHLFLYFVFQRELSANLLPAPNRNPISEPCILNYSYYLCSVCDDGHRMVRALCHVCSNMYLCFGVVYVEQKNTQMIHALSTLTSYVYGIECIWQCNM